MVQNPDEYEADTHLFSWMRLDDHSDCSVWSKAKTPMPKKMKTIVLYQLSQSKQWYASLKSHTQSWAFNFNFLDPLMGSIKSNYKGLGRDNWCCIDIVFHIVKTTTSWFTKSPWTRIRMTSNTTKFDGCLSSDLQIHKIEILRLRINIQITIWKYFKSNKLYPKFMYNVGLFQTT